MTDDDWRARKKAATKQSIQEHALRLFVEKGYDATTVDEIAAAAGVSHMTFFRYFPRKEAVVEYDEYDPMIEELIAARPPHESPLTALHNAITRRSRSDPDHRSRGAAPRTRLVLRNPVLRSRNLLAQDTTRDLFARALARRAGLPCRDFACTVQASAALGAIGTAMAAWAAGEDDDPVALLDAAFAALRAG